MKKILSFVLVACFLGTAGIGCGETKTDKKVEKKTETTTKETTETKKP